MFIGVPKEIKNNEFRVGMVPAGIKALVAASHTVYVEKGAGLGSGFADSEYEQAGAQILETAKDVFDKSEMIIKVKEPLKAEYGLCRPGQILFTYFHFAASKPLTDAMMAAKSTCIAYETIQTLDRHLPLLEPMSEVAGRMSIQEGAKYLEKPMGGRGVLLGGVPGVEPAEVVIIGGGIVGQNAARMAAGLGARVTIFDISIPRLRYLSEIMPPNVVTMMSNEHNIVEKLRTADLVIGAVLVTGAITPKLIRKYMLKEMKQGAVIVDVAIDQGGCCETSHPTTHDNPVYELDGIVHYAVANIPGAVSRTSTLALTNATLPYALKIANQGFPQCAKTDKALALGVNMTDGKITFKPVADAFGLAYTSLEEL